MEAKTAEGALGSDVEPVQGDPVAEQLKHAKSDDERARILAPCIAEVIREQGPKVNILNPNNPIHAGVRAILCKTGVLER